MEDCPNCGAVRSFHYNIFLDAYQCRVCRLGFEPIDDDTVEDYIFKDNRFVLASTYTLAWEEPEANELDEERLAYLRKQYAARAWDHSDEPTNTHVKRTSRNDESSEE